MPNDCDLGRERRLWLLTGPNMAGKSTFLRQNALIAVMAQAGSFVPAKEATIGIVDRLFSRVGAADDLARGRSTFMVEMVETAAILNQATARSLVILDEIGRGTATFDGLSIAWATLEHLHDVNKCRALFATHFHELGALKERLAALAPYTMRVKEWQNEVVFLHEVAPGAADRSYGIHVAQLAGLPAAVVSRAEEVLAALEKGEQSGAVSRLADDLPLFAAAPARPAGGVAKPQESEVEKALAEVNPDELSPREALELLYALRRRLPRPSDLRTGLSVHAAERPIVRLGLLPAGDLAKERREAIAHEGEQQSIDQPMGGGDGGGVPRSVGQMPGSPRQAGVGPQRERDRAAGQQEEMDLQRPPQGKGLAQRRAVRRPRATGSISTNREAAAVHSTAASST